MSLIEGVGDEVTQFFVVVISVLVVYIAWWTTSISEQRQLRTVFLIDRQSRAERTAARRNIPEELNTEASTMSEVTSPPQEVEAEATSEQTNHSKPPEASTSINGQTTAAATAVATAAVEEQNRIVEVMDADVVRQRRAAFYNRQDTLIGEPIVSSENSYGNEEEDTETSCIKIKLKYINDELKLVEARLQETVGEFKRRHFYTELNSNKIVRLIFNGRVLQPDELSLQSCGLFDNCVIHCLIHNKRASIVDTDNASNNSDSFMRRNHNRQRLPQMNNNNNNNNQDREFDFGNVLFALISFILGSAWYFRFLYAPLYTITATVALVVITGIFSVVVIGMYFPDQEAVPQRRQSEQR